MNDWKEVLYKSYVSSGQAPERGNSSAAQFRHRADYLESTIRDHFPADRASRILDIGCGHGVLLYVLQQMGYGNIRGVDGSAEQVEFAKRLGVAGVELGDGMTFLRQCGSESVDVVCLFDVLEHLTRQEAFDLIVEVRRVLSPGGVCIGHAPNAEGIFGARVRHGDLTHEQAFTPKSINQMFRALQFEDIRCFEHKPVVHGIKSMLRRFVWEVTTVPFRIMLIAEMGVGGHILSQNLLFTARRPPHQG
ncbi:MAG: class I SAM-dependent methyltransferase [Acidobacteriaceae bacterium]